MKVLILALMVLLAGCANNPVSNMITAYCAEANPALRLVMKAELASMGVVLPVDYCLARTIALASAEANGE